MAAKDLLQPAIYRHAQEGDLVFEFLARTPAGIFVEVGANDPEDGSQTLRLEQNGWHGLLVEPLREHAADLRRVRKAHVEEVACGPRDKHDTLMNFKVAGVASTLADEFINHRVSEQEVRAVRVMTLDSLLEKHGIDRIDFLSLDVEGYELQVLDGFSVERYRPAFILIEDRVRDLRIHDYMTANGYKVVRRSGANGWYVPAATDFPVSLYGRLQLFRKYHLERPLRGAFSRLRHRLYRRD
ncbi:FkbM family methyltransferase [Mesorhizobium sp. CAU 1741]|uniref:FkbM family methyltransferase n=1 Tax=Mesorhizobium sp. CAU 1741 TaxID=3140366 RepID=UPI00325C129E